MKISQDGINLIKKYEGVRYKPYRCPAGLWTVGVGHLIGDGKQLPDSYNRNFTNAEIDALLSHDLNRFEMGVCRMLPSLRFKQSEFDALVSFSFNLGLGGLQRSTLRQKVLRGDFEGAAEEFLKYTIAGGKVLKGLVSRRNDERALFLS